MLACAQEQIYNKAVTGKMKHKILASLCQQNFVLYQEVAKHAHNLSKVNLTFIEPVTLHPYFYYRISHRTQNSR